MPANILVYSFFIKEVDRLDKLRLICPTEWKEERVTMSPFTFLLHLIIINARVLLIGIDRPGTEIIDIADKKTYCHAVHRRAIAYKQESRALKTVPCYNKGTAEVSLRM